jgi:hypothetical protein
VVDQVIAFPDAEATAVTWLTGRLGTGVGVSTRIPNPRPAKLCRVTRTGGVRRDLVTDDAQLTFECWGPTETDAFEICRLARAYLYAAAGQTVGGVFVRKVTDVGGPTNFPDPESDSPRYQFTATVAVRGAAI